MCSSADGSRMYLRRYLMFEAARHWRTRLSPWGPTLSQRIDTGEPSSNTSGKVRQGIQVSRTDAQLLRGAYRKRGHLRCTDRFSDEHCLPAWARRCASTLWATCQRVVSSWSIIRRWPRRLVSRLAHRFPRSRRGQPGILRCARDEASHGSRWLACVPASGSERSGRRSSMIRTFLLSIHSDDFSSAVAALARHELPRTGRPAATTAQSLARPPQSDHELAVVQDIDLIYSIGKARVVVPQRPGLDETGIFLTPARSMDGIRGLVAIAVAHVVRSTGLEQQRLADSDLPPPFGERDRRYGSTTCIGVASTGRARQAPIRLMTTSRGKGSRRLSDNWEDLYWIGLAPIAILTDPKIARFHRSSSVTQTEAARPPPALCQRDAPGSSSQSGLDAAQQIRNKPRSWRWCLASKNRR